MYRTISVVRARFFQRVCKDNINKQELVQCTRTQNYNKCGGLKEKSADMNKHLYRLTYAKADDMDEACFIIRMLRRGEEPDESIMLNDELYILVATYESIEQSEGFREDARRDVQEYKRQQEENVQRNYSLPQATPRQLEADSGSGRKIASATQEEDKESVNSGESEARAVVSTKQQRAHAEDAESVWDSDGAEEVGKARASPTVHDWRPYTQHTRRPFIPVYTGDKECDEYWANRNAQRLNDYMLGLHEHVQKLCDDAYNKRRLQEIIDESRKFKRQLVETRDKLEVKWEIEDKMRRETLEDATEAERARSMYKRLVAERARKVQQRARDAARDAKVDKIQHPERYSQLQHEDKLEAARKAYLRARSKCCTQERAEEEKQRLDNIREYRFYTALIEEDTESLPREDRKKDVKRLLEDKPFILRRMQFEEHRRVTLLSKGDIYALSLDDYIMWKRMQGIKTSEWSWIDAILKYQQYCVALGLITGINEEEEEQNKFQREAFQETTLTKFMSS